jgi:hypothetical protein
MIARSVKDLEGVWSQLEGSKWLTDKIIGFGPFGIGLNGITALATDAVPVLGIGVFQAFTLMVGLYLLMQAFRARTSPGAMIAMALVLLLDAAFDLLDLLPVPFLGGLVDAIFRGPLLAAKIIQKDIERTHWIEGSARDAHASGQHAKNLAEMHAQKKKRLVYLAD